MLSKHRTIMKKYLNWVVRLFLSSVWRLPIDDYWEQQEGESVYSRY
jgi:hypothetical protein